MRKVFTAHVEFDPETRMYVGTVPGLPGAHSQAATLDELRKNLVEVLALTAPGARSMIKLVRRPRRRRLAKSAARVLALHDRTMRNLAR